MSKPIVHARYSASRFGGKPEDYLPIHDFMDSSKAFLGDVRHRALFHHAFGCFVVEKVFGHEMQNSDDKTFSPRDIAEQHILDDLGHIPTVNDYFDNMNIQPWMAGGSSGNIPSKGALLRSRIAKLTNELYAEFREELLEKMRLSGVKGFRWIQWVNYYDDSHYNMSELFSFEYLTDEWEEYGGYGSIDTNVEEFYNFLEENGSALKNEFGESVFITWLMSDPNHLEVEDYEH